LEFFVDIASDVSWNWFLKIPLNDRKWRYVLTKRSGRGMRAR